MGRTLAGKDLVPGKLYTFWGKQNTHPWLLYTKRQTLNYLKKDDPTPVSITLWPLEAFVFLERIPSELAFDKDDDIFDYKLLTSSGEVGWICLHEDDLNALKICFRECKLDKT